MSNGFHSWSELEPAHYSDPAVLARERTHVFEHAWTPVALTSDLQQDRDFIAAEVAGRSVVVQNFAGTLRAFENVCSHRQSPLRTCARGNGPLRCPYHGWTFDSAGLPSGIPQRRSFGDLSPSLLQQLALDRWALEVVGPLVFVARQPRAALTDSLGALAHELGGVLARGQRCLDRNVFELACNWKVMLENGLDAYHVPLVHAQSIHKHGLDEITRERHADHSVGRFVAASSARVLRALRYAYPEAALTDRYTHYLIYPNTYVVDVYGLFSVISRMDPISEASTRFESAVFVSWDGEQGNAALREELNASNAAFFRNGYQEDKLICEQVQRALSHTTRRALFSADEERIAMFHQAWSRDMAEAA